MVKYIITGKRNQTSFNLTGLGYKAHSKQQITHKRTETFFFFVKSSNF